LVFEAGLSAQAARCLAPRGAPAGFSSGPFYGEVGFTRQRVKSGFFAKQKELQTQCLLALLMESTNTLDTADYTHNLIDKSEFGSFTVCSCYVSVFTDFSL